MRFAGIVTLSEQPRILRLRARPTRNSSGSEILCGRSAQDDNSMFRNNAVLAHHLFEFQGIGRHGAGWRFNHFQDLIGVADAVNDRNRAQHGDHP